MIRAFNTLEKLRDAKDKAERDYRIAMQSENELKTEIEEAIKEELLEKDVSVSSCIAKIGEYTYFKQYGEFKILSLEPLTVRQKEALRLLNQNIGE